MLNLANITVQDLVPLSSDLSDRLTMLIETGEAGTIEYIGWAAPGTEPTEQKWRIQKITQSGPITSIVWAMGRSTFSFAWANRKFYIYS